MSKIRVFDESITNINYTTRVSKNGKEYGLVEKYLQYIIKTSKRNTKFETSIFIEPRIESGYPDIVIVKHLPIQAELKRNVILNKNDFRILFYIQQNSNVSLEKIADILGFSRAELVRVLSKLEKCNLIKLNKIEENEYYKITFKKNLIKKIISIEAKIDKWNEVIKQASVNSWFSTESYILMNKVGCNETILNKCRDLGLGIILVNGKIEKILRSEIRKFPVSYASLQFYNWIALSQKYTGG